MDFGFSSRVSYCVSVYIDLSKVMRCIVYVGTSAINWVNIEIIATVEFYTRALFLN